MENIIIFVGAVILLIAGALIGEFSGAVLMWIGGVALFLSVITTI